MRAWVVDEWTRCRNLSRTEQGREVMRRLSFGVLIALILYLLAFAIHEQQKADSANIKRDKAISALAGTQKGIVTKLTEVFVQAQAAEEAAREARLVPPTTVAAIVESLKGYVDPILVKQALDAAKKAVVGPQGPPGPAGPPGPVGASASATTTSTVRAGTTSTTRPPTTTTTLPAPTTTTTRACLVRVLGLKLGC